MSRATERITELEQMALEAAEIIDNADQSRIGLSNALDEIRNVISTAYGEDFEDDLAQHLGVIYDDEVEEE